MFFSLYPSSCLFFFFFWPIWVVFDSCLTFLLYFSSLPVCIHFLSCLLGCWNGRGRIHNCSLVRVLPFSTLPEGAAFTWGDGERKGCLVRKRKGCLVTMEAAHSAFSDPHYRGGLGYSKRSLVGRHARSPTLSFMFSYYRCLGFKFLTLTGQIVKGELYLHQKNMLSI